MWHQIPCLNPWTAVKEIRENRRFSYWPDLPHFFHKARNTPQKILPPPPCCKDPCLYPLCSRSVWGNNESTPLSWHSNRVQFEPFRTLTNFISNPKNRTLPNPQSGIVYKFRAEIVTCLTSAIADADGRLEDARGTEKATHATMWKSELAEHCWETGHPFHLDAPGPWPETPAQGLVDSSSRGRLGVTHRRA